MKKLFEVTDIAGNTEHCVTFAVTGSPAECVETGFLAGDEVVIKLYREGVRSLFVGRKDGSHYTLGNSDGEGTLRGAVADMIMFDYRMPVDIGRSTSSLKVVSKDSIPKSLSLLLAGAGMYNDGVLDTEAVADVRLADGLGLLGTFKIGSFFSRLGGRYRVTGAVRSCPYIENVYVEWTES